MGSEDAGPGTNPSYQSAKEQRRAYVEGEWGNPLTTTLTGGRILSALQLPLFLTFPPRGFGVLTTIGRTTGKKRRKCVRAIPRGDNVFLVSLRARYGAWYRNLTADPHVELRIREGRFRGIAREIRDAGEYARAQEAYCETFNFFDRLEYLVHRVGWPTKGRIRDLHVRWFTVGTPIVLDLDRSVEVR